MVMRAENVQASQTPLRCWVDLFVADGICMFKFILFT
jgi:hypothetical protein